MTLIQGIWEKAEELAKLYYPFYRPEELSQIQEMVEAGYPSPFAISLIKLHKEKETV